MFAVEGSELTPSLLVAEERDATAMLCVVTKRCYTQ